MNEENSNHDLELTVQLRKSESTSLSVLFYDGDTVPLSDDEEAIVLRTVMQGGASGPKGVISTAFRLVRQAMLRSVHAESRDQHHHEIVIFVRIDKIDEIFESLRLTDENPYEFLLDCDFGFKWCIVPERSE